MKKIRLGVNIDHVATVRNARGEFYPSPLRAALLAEKNGADSVTIHLREDRRHINELDLKQIKSKLNLFVEPRLKDIYESKNLNADCVEIHTGKLCNLINKKKDYKKEFEKIKKAVIMGKKLNLEVHAGHGLTFNSAKILSKLKGIHEFNIGHFLIGEAIFIGLSNSIKTFKKTLKT